MGGAMSMLEKMKFWNKKLCIVMVGLNMSGKTTILYKLKPDKIGQNYPTIAFNMEKVECNGVEFTILDVPRRESDEMKWKHFSNSAQGLIFVVDSNEKDNINEAKDELHRMVNHPNLRNEASLLVFANKQDLPNALSVPEIIDKLDLRSLHRNWHVQAAIATSGEGLYEGLNWISNNTNN